MRDPYDILVRDQSASEADVKKAFRSLPSSITRTQNQNDPKAQAKFAEVNQAYEILGDKEKRAKFDRGEIDARGQARASRASRASAIGPWRRRPVVRVRIRAGRVQVAGPWHGRVRPLRPLRDLFRRRDKAAARPGALRERVSARAPTPTPR